MKIGLLAAFAAALLLAGSLYYWRTRAEVEPNAAPTAAPSPSKSTPPADVRLEAAPANPSAQAPEQPDSRTVASEPQPSARVPDSAEPPMVDLGSDASAASIGAARAGEYDEFAKKYRTTSARDRKQALETIEAMLLAHKRGTEDKTQALSEDQVVALNHEIEWLGANPAP